MATEKSSTVTPAVSNVAHLNHSLRPYGNEALFSQFKETFCFADALLRLHPRDGSTEEYLLVLLHGRLEEMMWHYEKLTEQDVHITQYEVATRGLDAVMADFQQSLAVEA